MEEGSQSVSQLLIAWGRGELTALEELTPWVYNELHKLARAYLRRGSSRQSLQPTALIKRDLPAIARSVAAGRVGEPSAFFRYRGTDHAHDPGGPRPRAIRRQKGRRRSRHALDGCVAVSPHRAPNVLEVDQALRRLAEVDDRKARVIEMRYFGGMDREEIATAVGLTLATVKRDLRLGEAWLRRFLAGERSQ
jgi:hypothetical protein